jgi:RHS repeat-associated protein
MSASVLVRNSHRDSNSVKPPKFTLASALLVATALTLISTEAAYTQSTGPLQQWAGQNNGVVVGFDTPQEACESNAGQYIPRFGRTVGALTSFNPAPDTENPWTGVEVPAYDCHYGGDTIRSLLGCTDGYKLVHGVCIPGSYPVTAEPACKGSKGLPGQYPAVGDPVSLSTGSKCEEVTDYSSGGPYPIEIKRYYRSMMMPRDADSIGFGLAWRADLVGRKLRIEYYNYNMVISREDGAQTRFLNPNNVPHGTDWEVYSIETYQKNGSTYVQGQGDARDRFRIVDDPTCNYYVYQDEDDRIDFFCGLRLAKTRWKGGYERNYTYAPDDSSGDRPIQISDSFGRVVNITWDGNKISEISLPDGTKLQYSYEARAVSGETPSANVLTQVTRRQADTTLIDSKTYQYAPPRPGTQVPLLTGVTDAKGVTIDTTTYDDIGRVLTAQGPGGANAVGIIYDDQAGTRTVTNALGQVNVYTFAKLGLHYYGDPDTSLLRMTSVERQQSATVPAASMSFVRDFNEYVKTDWNGRVTRYTYDELQNETQRIEDENGIARTITTTWSPAFHLPTQIVAPNLTTNFTYDTLGRMTRREEIDTSARQTVTRAWTYTWNSLGLLETVTGPRTDVVQTTTYTYDANGNLATVRNALNQTTTVNSVNAAGLPTSITDQNGVVTLMTYDPLGRIKTTSVQGPTPATTTFIYDENGLLTSVTSPTNVTLTYGYDDAHRLTSIQDSHGNKMLFALDGLGNRLQAQIETGTAQVLMNNSATFDSLGRLLTSIGATNQTTLYEYDNNGNLTKLTDPRNAVIQTAFDGLNRVEQTTDALNGVTDLAYDMRDYVASVTDAKNHVTTYTVNGFGFVTQVVSPDSGTTVYTYDLAGNVKSRKDARKIVTNYTYDALDRPLTRTLPSATTENVTYSYDSTANGNFGVGRLTSLTDAAGTASFAYDAYGNRIQEKRTIAGIVYTTSYEYDLSGEFAKITYPSGFIVNYQRDDLGQISGVTYQTNAAASPVTLASGIDYMPFGGMQAMTLGNGVQVTNSYDLDYRLTRTQATGSTALQDLTLGYDDSGNINSIGDAVTANLSQTFQYDLAGRLTQGVGAYGTENYTYDALGNRLTRSVFNGGATNTTYTYTSTNTRLASAATGSQTLSYTYDANGARTAVKLGNQTQASYTYNADGRLATSGTNAFKYNAFGERSVATVTGGGTHFIFAEDGKLLSEHGLTGALVRNYIYLNGEPFALVDGAGTVSYILNDQVGQPQKMLNTAGAVSWHRVAGIYGNTVSQPVGTTAANPLRFPGQQFDANLGLHYNYFRTYDPATGRYLETDPIGLEGGMNLYAYVDGNPVNYVDPDGEIPLLVPVLGVIGRGIVGGIGGGAADIVIQGARLLSRGCNVFDPSNYNGSDILASAGVGAAAGAIISGPISAVGRIFSRHRALRGVPRRLHTNREVYRRTYKATAGDIGKQAARGAGVSAAKKGIDAATGSGNDCGSSERCQPR